jgi:sporulation protein YlmC with PRC-barrel domain
MSKKSTQFSGLYTLLWINEGSVGGFKEGESELFRTSKNGARRYKSDEQIDIPIERVNEIKWLLLIDPSDGHLK